MSGLYETIVSLCDARDIRPGKFCSDVGVSRGLMTDLKMGRKKGVSAETAQKIAGYFGVSVGYLLGQSSAPDVLDEVDIGFYGNFRQLDEKQKETVRDMVRVMRMMREESK